jgi:tyrosine-protein phosphatase YwqE
MIHIVSSDVHRTRNCIYDNFNETYKKLKKIVGKDKAEIMLNDNPLAVLENRPVVIEEPREYKRHFWEDFI